MSVHRGLRGCVSCRRRCGRPRQERPADRCYSASRGTRVRVFFEHPQCAVGPMVADALRRALAAAPPLPSKSTRLSVLPPMPPIRAEPSHCGTSRPCRTRMLPRDDRRPGTARPDPRVSGLAIGTPSSSGCRTRGASRSLRFQFVARAPLHSVNAGAKGARRPRWPRFQRASCWGRCRCSDHLRELGGFSVARRIDEREPSRRRSCCSWDCRRVPSSVRREIAHGLVRIPEQA